MRMTSKLGNTLSHYFEIEDTVRENLNKRDRTWATQNIGYLVSIVTKTNNINPHRCQKILDDLVYYIK